MILSPKNTATAAALVGLAASASASLVIYEPFDYADTEGANNALFLGDGNQAGGLGIGEWRQVTNSLNADGSPFNEIEVTGAGLTFTDGGGNSLPSSGGYARKVVRVGQAAVSSDVDAASTAALTADGSTMWMSFIFQDQGFSGPTSALMLASEDMIASDNHNLSSAGYGVGIVIRDSGNQTRAINTAYYNNSTSYTRVAEANPTFLVSGGPENTSFLLAAKINWNVDGTLDEIFVFNIDDLTTEPDEADAIASDTFDMSLVNQLSLDVLNIGETQADAYDEIRFGTTFADVVGGSVIPEPSSLALLGLGGLLIVRRRR